MRKYDSYKDSGAEWLGEIPTNWQAVKMKYLFRDYSEKNKPEETLLSVTQSQGVVPRDWVESRMVMPSGNLESFKYIKKGDFAISLRSFEGGLEYCHHDGIISPAYTVLKLRDDLKADYYKWLLKSTSFISEIQTSVVGIREGKNISYPELSYSLMPIPKSPEQTAIATFLDQKTAQIDRAIAQKERLIELLRERKQIVIQQAVTRGLDPTVKMKDSGVEWIGRIPEHWEVKKLKYVASIRGGFAFNGSDFVDEGVQLIKISNTYNNKLSLERQPTFLPHNFLNSHKDWVVTKGDILMSLTGTLGKRDYGFAILLDTSEKFLLNQRVAKITSIGEVEESFILLLLRNEQYLNQLYTLPSGTKQANLSNENVIGLEVAIPPPNERVEIIEKVKNEHSKIDQSIHLHLQQIAKLKEYRTVLIDAAVTGKIRV